VLVMRIGFGVGDAIAGMGVWGRGRRGRCVVGGDVLGEVRLGLVVTRGRGVRVVGTYRSGWRVRCARLI